MQAVLASNGPGRGGSEREQDGSPRNDSAPASGDLERAQDGWSPDDSIQAADGRAPVGQAQASDEAVPDDQRRSAATCFLPRHCRGRLQKSPPDTRGQKIPKAATQTERV